MASSIFKLLSLPSSGSTTTASESATTAQVRDGLLLFSTGDKDGLQAVKGALLSLRSEVCVLLLNVIISSLISFRHDAHTYDDSATQRIDNSCTLSIPQVKAFLACTREMCGRMASIGEHLTLSLGVAEGGDGDAAAAAARAYAKSAAAVLEECLADLERGVESQVLAPLDAVLTPKAGVEVRSTALVALLHFAIVL
jgi:hypothetical protein